MERKLVKHGPSTFMVSLPKRWIDRHNFQKGDSIKYEERPDSITFFAHDSPPESKGTEVDVSGLDRTTLLFFLRGLYRKGFADITLRFKEPTAHHHRTGKNVRISTAIAHEIQRLIGVEIASYERNAIVIKQLAEPSQDEFENSLRRVFLQMRMMIREMLDDLESGDREALETTKDKVDSVTKLISFCLRILHSEHKWENTPYLTTILMQLETLNYHVWHLVRFLIEEKADISESAFKVVSHIYELQELVEQLFYNWDNKKAARFNEVREEVDSALDSVKQDEKHLSYFMHPMITLQRSIIQARLSMKDKIMS